jgi:trans-aconitate 2-methyltransferase
LRPLLAQLNPLDSERFLEQYGDRMKDAYPQGPDGKTVLPFKRIFIVVRR